MTSSQLSVLLPLAPVVLFAWPIFCRWILCSYTASPTGKHLLPVWGTLLFHVGVIMSWKHFPHNWPFVRGIHRWTMDSPHRGPVMQIFNILCIAVMNRPTITWTNIDQDTWCHMVSFGQGSLKQPSFSTRKYIFICKTDNRQVFEWILLFDLCGRDTYMYVRNLTRLLLL